MRTLIYGAGPIGRWLAFRLQQAGQDVTLLARNQAYRSLERNGIEIVDGLTNEWVVARVKLVDRLDPEDRYDLVVVAMQKDGLTIRDVDYQGNKNLLEVALRAGVRCP